MKPTVSLLFLALFGLSSYGQGDLYLELTSWKFQDDARELIANLSAYDEEGNEILPAGITVSFSVLDEGKEEIIGETVSDETGRAVLKIEPGHEFPRDEEGYMQFYSRFEGDEQYGYAESELMIKDARLAIDFRMIDSVKTVVYSGVMENEPGVEEPLADDDCYLYVPRMFNLLRIEDGWLEEEGTGYYEFSPELIGDSTGAITIIARIEEHFDYGNLEASGVVNWALPKHSERFEGPRRELWTPIAPKWMIVTLIIMLAGVWGHYFYAIYELFMIRRAGKKADRSS